MSWAFCKVIGVSNIGGFPVDSSESLLKLYEESLVDLIGCSKGERSNFITLSKGKWLKKTFLG